MIFILILAVTFLLYLKSRWQRRDLFKLAEQLKCSYRGLPFIGHTYFFAGGEEHRMKTLNLFGRDAIKHGGTIAVWQMSELFIFVADPIVAETVLKSCLEKADVVRFMRPVLGNGSLFAPVPIWRPRRKIVAQIFGMKYLTKFMDIFVRQSSIMADNMRQTVGKGSFSIWNKLTAYTIDSICETTLGVKLEAQKVCAHPFVKSIDVLTNLAATRACRPWLHSDFVFTNSPYWKTVIKEKSAVYDFINKIIRDKRETVNVIKEGKNQITETSGNNLMTFLELLMQSSGGNISFTDVELLEETLVIVTAGTDTSAVAIGFTLLMLSRHSDVQEKVYEELKEVFGDSDKKIENADLPRLIYLEAVIKETLRQYPPVPVIVRKVEKDTELPTGVKLVKGCTVLIHIRAIHRNPEYWGDDADVYRPERFIKSKLKHPAAFIPFSHGPRGCVGSQYAMMSMKTALATLLRKYKVLPPADSGSKSDELRTKFDIMMRHVEGYELRLEFRKQ